MSVDFNLILKITNKLDASLLEYTKGNLSFAQESYLDESFNDIDLIAKIHPSHFDELFKTAGLLDRDKIKVFAKKSPSLALKTFLQNDIFERLSYYMPVLPYKFLSDFYAKKLLFLDDFELTKVIHLLGLFDLKESLKTLIDPKLITKINESLSQEMRQFLKTIQTEKEKVSFKKIQLENWDLTKEGLFKLLYVRGLNRIAKALSQENIYVLNEILLRLPVKDKPLFLSLNTEIEPGLKQNLAEQIDKTLNFYKNHHNP